uniref:Uncharacterized protein n=1 Tax=Lepeophtheirus salmonis TaxID=72036 RepID=A0A0K2UEA9_LEPSM
MASWNKTFGHLNHLI